MRLRGRIEDRYLRPGRPVGRGGLVGYGGVDEVISGDLDRCPLASFHRVVGNGTPLDAVPEREGPEATLTPLAVEPELAVFGHAAGRRPLPRSAQLAEGLLGLVAGKAEAVVGDDDLSDAFIAE